MARWDVAGKQEGIRARLSQVAVDTQAIEHCAVQIVVRIAMLDVRELTCATRARIKLLLEQSALAFWLRKWKDQDSVVAMDDDRDATGSLGRAAAEIMESG
jgi:hypothetical protein